MSDSARERGGDGMRVIDHEFQNHPPGKMVYTCQYSPEYARAILSYSGTLASVTHMRYSRVVLAQGRIFTDAPPSNFILQKSKLLLLHTSSETLISDRPLMLLTHVSAA